MKNFVGGTRAQLCPRLNRNTREAASVDTHGEKDKIVTVLPANRFCASPSTSLLLTVVVYTRSYTQSIDISVFFLSNRSIHEPWVNTRTQGDQDRHRGIETEIGIGSQPYLSRNLIISREGEGILSRVQKVTLQHWKIYRKIAGGREVQTNSAEKLIERDRGNSVLGREASRVVFRARESFTLAGTVCASTWSGYTFELYGNIFPR